MSTKLAEHERELAEATARLEHIIARRKALVAEEDELASVVNGWKAIVASERREHSGGSTPTALSVKVSDSFQLNDEDEEENENKTQFVRDRIQERAALGTKADDLKKAAKAAGMKHPPSWPYGPLQRLKKKGEIIKRKGKYYPNAKQAGLALAG